MKTILSRLDVRGNLLPEYFPEAALKGFLCPGCLNPVEFYDGWLLVTNRTVACNCGVSYDMFSAKVVLTPDNPAYAFLKERNLRDASWFHATTEINWERVLARKGNFTIHAGTEQAAFDRALGVYLRRPPAGFQESFELYELRLKPQATIADRIIHDGNFEKFLLGRNHLIRYINRWEDPSSISLAGRSNAFEFVGKRTVSGDEALERISIYNVRP